MSSKQTLIGLSQGEEKIREEMIYVDDAGETEEELDVLAASESGAHLSGGKDDVEFGENEVRSAEGMKFKSSLTNGEKVRIFGRIQKNINDLNALCEEHYAIVVAHPDPTQHISFYGSRSLVRTLYESSLSNSLKSGGLMQKTPTYMPVADVQHIHGEEEIPESHLYSKVLRLMDLYNFPSKEHFSFKQKGSKKVNNPRPKPEYWPPNVRYVPLLSGHMANIIEDDPHALSQYTRRSMILRVLKYVRRHYRTLVNMLMTDGVSDQSEYSSGEPDMSTSAEKSSNSYKERRTYTLKRKIVIDPERRARIDAGDVPVRTWEQIRDQNMDAWSSGRKYTEVAKPPADEDQPMPKLKMVKDEPEIARSAIPSKERKREMETSKSPLDTEAYNHQVIHKNENTQSNSIGDTVYINGQEYTIVASNGPGDEYSPLTGELIVSNYLEHPSTSSSIHDSMLPERSGLSVHLSDSGGVASPAGASHAYSTEDDSFAPPAELVLTPVEEEDHPAEGYHRTIIPSLQSSGVCRLVKTITYERSDGPPVIQKYIVKARRNEGS